MNQENKIPIGRLAYRVDGDLWNCYYAPRIDSLEGAILLASIRFSLVKKDPRNKKDFMNFMRKIHCRTIKSVFGIAPTWEEPIPAPESERSGNG
jgi:hypothetical protein